MSRPHLVCFTGGAIGAYLYDNYGSCCILLGPPCNGSSVIYQNSGGVGKPLNIRGRTHSELIPKKLRNMDDGAGNNINFFRKQYRGNC